MFHSSGKCQIIHWRQGHKQTCQQWHVNGGSNSGGLSPTESSEQMPFLTNLNSPLPGGDSHLHDMNFDTVSEPSFATTDNYILDTDLFLTDRSNMNESNQSLLSRVNSASVASCEKSNYSVDKETNSSEILSANKVAYLLVRFLFSKFVSFNSLPCAFRFQTTVMVVWMKRMATMILLILSIIRYNNPIIVLLKQQNVQKQASQFMNPTWVSI